MATLPLPRIEEVLHTVVTAVVIPTTVVPTEGRGRLASYLQRGPTGQSASRSLPVG
jgi:hypothetical protein